MSANHSRNSHIHADLGATEVDQVLAGLRPRLRAARIRHVRFLGAIIAIIPLLGASAMALGQNGGGDSVSVASGGEERPADDAPEDGDDGVGTDIGEAGGDEQAPAQTDDGEQTADAESGDEGDADQGSVANNVTEPVAPEDMIHEVEVATYGVVKVRVEADGIALIEALIHDPWDFQSAETNDDGALVIAVSDGESIKLITVGEGLWDEFRVRLDDFVVPTTTVKPEPKPEPRPEPEPEPQPPIVDRIVLQVPPAGSFVVEREGESLWGGNVQPEGGFDYDIIKAEGWKVHVAFFNETMVYHGKAWIDDFGQLKTQTWSEERVVEAEPVYQWVEIPGVGTVNFKHHEGLMFVVAIEAFEPYGSYVYNEVGESVKVDFEGEGGVWIVEAWAVEGVIQWSTSGPAT